MKTLPLFTLAALLASPACAQSCLVSGTIKGIGAKPIIFRYTQQGQAHRDTVRAINDHFTYTAKPSDDGKVALFISPPRYDSFWYGPGKLTVTGDAAQLGHLAIAGTPENDLAYRLKQDIEWKYEQARKAEPAAADKLSEQEQLATRQFIGQHPASRTAAEALYWQMLMASNAPLAGYEQLAAQLAPAVRQSFQGQQVAKRLLILQNRPTVGRPVADFTIADTAGVKHSLATYRGKYVLLDFWGHWCHPCIEAMPKVNALHQQYADKLTIIGVALEGSNSAPLWKKAIRQHQVPGLQLSELQGTDSPVITSYNINAFPTYMLLDPQGKLVALTNDVDEMAKKLATLGAL